MAANNTAPIIFFQKLKKDVKPKSGQRRTPGAFIRQQYVAVRWRLSEIEVTMPELFDKPTRTKRKIFEEKWVVELQKGKSGGPNISRHQESLPLPKPITRQQKHLLLQVIENPLQLPRLGLDATILHRSHMIFPNIPSHVQDGVEMTRTEDLR